MSQSKEHSKETLQANAVAAQTELHHQYFLGLQLMVATREGPAVVGDWMFALFRQQHEAKFLSSFDKLGLQDLPHAVACARYHVLSNGVGGVPVEYMEESSSKAWVRFRYPRWMFAGPTICGVPVEASRGFLRGWYAHNGVSLKNPKLGFVCVSEDMTGEYGLCGYFREFDEPLAEHERLQFAPNERPPAFDAAAQPSVPAQQWSVDRLARAKRNYAVEYIRNGLATLLAVVGRDRGLELAGLAARLTGLQHYAQMATTVGAVDAGVDEAAEFLVVMLQGLGDEVVRDALNLDSESAAQVVIKQSTLSVTRNLRGISPEDFFTCWLQLWQGAIHSHRLPMRLEAQSFGDSILWQLSAQEYEV